MDKYNADKSGVIGNKEKEKLPNVLWSLGFTGWDDFKRRISRERLVCKDGSENSRQLTKKICRRIIGANEWVSDREYKELFALAEKELKKIQATIIDAGRIEEKYHSNID